MLPIEAWIVFAGFIILIGGAVAIGEIIAWIKRTDRY